MSGLSQFCVTVFRMSFTRSFVSLGRIRNSFTVAVSSDSCTFGGSSSKPSGKVSSSSSELSIRSAYSPMIQIMADLASGSSSVSRFWHSVPMMDSYLFG